MIAIQVEALLGGAILDYVVAKKAVPVRFAPSGTADTQV